METEPIHALIIGPRRIGKTTLIRRVLKELDCPAVGYATKKEERLSDPVRGKPIYLYPVSGVSDNLADRIQTADNRVGWCLEQKPEPDSEAFNRFASQLLEPVPEGGIVVFDEVGFMEADAEAFASAILQRLDGSVPVLAAVKEKEIPFLEQVRCHPNCRRFYITEENRDTLAEEVIVFLKKQLKTV